MEWRNGEYIITDDSARVDLDFVCAGLAQSYWAAGRPREVTARAVTNSICFSLYYRDGQVGFARVVSDRATFAWICDVFIHPDHRGRGLGKWLMSCVTEYPEIRDTQQILKTRDAHGLYGKFGFEMSQCMRRRSRGYGEPVGA